MQPEVNFKSFQVGYHPSQPHCPLTEHTRFGQYFHYHNGGDRLKFPHPIYMYENIYFV